MAENISILRDENGDIDLVNMYVADINVPLPDIIKPVVRQHVVSRPFSGVESIDGGEDGEIVYVTPKGTVYHVSGTCSYIKTTVYTVMEQDIDNKRNKSGGKYYPCERCGMNVEGGAVYITLYGNRYHGRRDCTSIKRNAMAVFKSEVDGMGMCKKCGGK